MFSVLSLVLLLACFLNSAVAQTCNGSYQISFFAVESPMISQRGRNGPQLLSFRVDQTSTDEPTLRFFTSYKHSLIDFKVEQISYQPNSRFTISLNGVSSQRTYQYKAGGSLMKLAPFLSQGTDESTNAISIIFTDHNEDGSVKCTSTNVFHIVNPAAFPGM